MGKDYITLREASRRHNVPVTTLRRWCERGFLPAEKVLTARGPVWLVEEGALEGFERPRRGRRKSDVSTMQ